jgi:hypothetical protein
MTYITHNTHLQSTPTLKSTLKLVSQGSTSPRPPIWSAGRPQEIQFGQRSPKPLSHTLLKVFAPILAGISVALGGFGFSWMGHSEKKAATEAIATLKKGHQEAQTRVTTLIDLLLKMKTNKGSMMSLDWLKQKAAELVYSKTEDDLKKDIFKLFPKAQYEPVKQVLEGLSANENPTEEDFRKALVDFVQLTKQNGLQPDASEKLNREVEAVKAFNDSLKSFQFPAFQAPKDLVNQQESGNRNMWIGLIVGLLASVTLGGGLSFSVVKQ